MKPDPFQISPEHITTSWAGDVNPHHPWPEYPRPQLARDEWINLNGLWDIKIISSGSKHPSDFNQKILVPFPVESALSGVQHQLKPHETIWYHRIFSIPQTWENGRTLIHFGGVDWACQLSINGYLVGEHRGGYGPFTFDISQVVRSAENELLLAVQDPTDTQPIQRGKQVLKPQFIWYSAISGIWQTVWLEHVPDNYIQSLKIIPDIDHQNVKIESYINQGASGLKIRFQVFDQGKVIASDETTAGGESIISLPEPILWSPENPHLYDLKVSLLQGETPLDQVSSYFGMRKFSLSRTKDGVMRFHLNNKPYFLYGPLDQGYWPDGLYTPPTDEAVQWEINFLKKASFNMLRKHIKIEPARYYYHCDRAGLIVWQDMVSGGISPKPIWFFFAGLFKSLRDDRLYWRLGRGKPENRGQFKNEYQRMLETLFNVVSIAVWCPFNEGWGQFDAAEFAQWTRTIDPTRLVDHASGWFDQDAGDFKSKHIYFKPLPEPQPGSERAWVLSEFGGYSLNLLQNAWNPNKDFGYKKFKNKTSLTTGYINLLEDQLIPWVKAGLSAAVYTQTTDVETEVNGFLTYDRKINKMDLETIKKVHQSLYKISQEES